MNNETSQKTSNKNSMAKVMSIRDFRLLFGGATTSILGDQFAFIATPWLVLKLTGDPLALGIVLALEGIPRAVFMLLGGAITDRLSPRVIMLTADIIRFILTALMAVVSLYRKRPDVDAICLRPGFWVGGGICHPGREQHRAHAGRAERSAGGELSYDGNQPTGRVPRPDHCRYPDRRIFQIIPGDRPGVRHRCRSVLSFGRRAFG